MKKLFVIVLTIVFAGFISSCSKSPAENMTGEWKISDIQTTGEIPDDQMEVYKETMDGMKESSKLVYNADGTYEETILETTTTGTWKISDDGKKLTKKSEEGTKESVAILELSDSKFIAVSELGEIKNTMTFEKVK